MNNMADLVTPGRGAGEPVIPARAAHRERAERRPGHTGPMRMPAAFLLAVCIAATGCAGTAGPGATGSASPTTTSRQPATPPPAGPLRHAPSRLTAQDWPTYHRNAARTGAAPAKPAAGKLSIAWTRHLDGAVYGQPLAIGSLVIAATEGDSVYGLSRSTGRILWRAHL